MSVGEIRWDLFLAMLPLMLTLRMVLDCFSSDHLLVMALHPEIQKKAQADIEKVAPNRLPTFDDYDSLPYIKAIIKEILRWGTIAPLGLPHRVMEDDVYGSYFIPKGATVISNIWYMLCLPRPNSLINVAQGYHS